MKDYTGPDFVCESCGNALYPNDVVRWWSDQGLVRFFCSDCAALYRDGFALAAEPDLYQIHGLPSPTLKEAFERTAIYQAVLLLRQFTKHDSLGEWVKQMITEMMPAAISGFSDQELLDAIAALEDLAAEKSGYAGTIYSALNVFRKRFGLPEVENPEL